MEKAIQQGRNRTGIDMSPIDSKKMVSGAEGHAPSKSVDGMSLADMEQSYISSAEPLGSVPLPGTVKGALKTTLEKAQGHNPEMFINKLGERLAYERSGVRIYDCLIRKCQGAPDASQPQIPIDRLQHFRNEEAEHFTVLKECMESIGADPTAQTPDADVSALASSGLMKVIMDPRTSMSQCLEAMLTIEATDNDAWELMIQLADDLGLEDIRSRFEHCRKQEETHLKEIKQWYVSSVRQQAAAAPPRH